jgi:hypothetical protein
MTGRVIATSGAEWRGSRFAPYVCARAYADNPGRCHSAPLGDPNRSNGGLPFDKFRSTRNANRPSPGRGPERN